MYVGTQYPASTDIEFQILAQLGVNHICGYPTPPGTGDPTLWTVDFLNKYREKVESYGIKLDMVQLPIGATPEQESPNILLGKSPERDREIEICQNIIRNAALAGIPAIKYRLMIIGYPRTKSTLGRGNSIRSAFYWDQVEDKTSIPEWGPISEDEYWERIDYLLKNIVPVAEEYKVRLACHPQDPYTPPGYKGVVRVLGTVEGMKKFVLMHESKYHGINFCQGTICEMLENPKTEIFDVIKWFGEREKIFNVHFRNIVGKKLAFEETFPDEGDIDMLKTAQAYKEIGYKYMLMPDHTPKISGPDPNNVSFAFCYGYIKAIIQAINQ